MKKIKYLLLITLIVVLSTGCVKLNVNMEVKKDKSMDFNIVYAIDKSLLNEESELKKDDFKEAEKAGFTITDYEDDKMKGFTLSQKIENIDDVSTESDAEYSLSNLMGDSENDSKYYFKIKKGLFKNTYTANFKFDANSNELNTNTDTEDEVVLPDENDAIMDDSSDESDLFNQEDLSKLMSTMDLSFNVTLPYGAGKNNATKVDGKKLTWSMSVAQASNIQFEFNIYNLPLIGATVGILVLIVIIILFILFKRKKNKSELVTNNNETPITSNNLNSNVIPEEPVMNENPVTLNENN